MAAQTEVPIDRFQKLRQRPTTKARAKKNRAKRLLLAAFMQQRSFLFHTRHTVNGLFPLRVCGLHDKRGFSWRPVKEFSRLRSTAQRKVWPSPSWQCYVKYPEMIVKKSPRDLHRPMTYRCRYEKVARANSLPETVKLIVERPYVISMRGT